MDRSKEIAPRQDVVAALVNSHRQFRAFVERRVGNLHDAEEILQAAFVKSVDKGDTIRDGESAVAWFYRLLRNAVIDHYRHRDAERRALEREAAMLLPETLEPDEERAVCQCVNDLLLALGSGHADLLRRIDLEGASIAEVAIETGMTANHVRVKLHRARAALRKQLERSCGTCTEHGCLDCSCRSSHPPGEGQV
jgi:RNA polymerase sigma factor (sigma-70 family)